MPALAFSFASCPSAGLCEGVLVFLTPALAADQREPKASPPAVADLAAAGFVVDATAVGAPGAGTEVK